MTAVRSRPRLHRPRAAYEAVSACLRATWRAAEQCDLGLATAKLGNVEWRTCRKAIPACHFTHGCADAAAILGKRHGIKLGDIRRCARCAGRKSSKRCASRRRQAAAQNSYDAQLAFLILSHRTPARQLRAGAPGGARTRGPRSARARAKGSIRGRSRVAVPQVLLGRGHRHDQRRS